MMIHEKIILEKIILKVVGDPSTLITPSFRKTLHLFYISLFIDIISKYCAIQLSLIEVDLTEASRKINPHVQFRT